MRVASTKNDRAPSFRKPARSKRIALGVAALMLSGLAQAQIYAGRDAGGVIVLSNFQSDGTPTLLVSQIDVATPRAGDMPAPITPALSPRTAGGTLPVLPERYAVLISAVAREQGLPASLLAAIAAAESGFDASAVSRRGAGGLMQLTPETARRFNVRDRFSAEDSLRGAAAYLLWLHRRFDNDLHKVLAAYNAGEQAVLRAGGIPPYAETQAYVPKVLRLMKHFDAPVPRSALAPRV